MSSFRKITRGFGMLAMIGAAAIAGAVSITAPIGTDNGGGYPFTFVGASDGNVWLSTNFGHRNGSWYWQNLVPLNVSFGVGVTSPGGYPAAYAVATDGNLYIIHQIGNAWYTANIGTPAGVALRKPVGVFSNTSNQPFVFLLGSDGNLWLAHNAGSWTWRNLGTPSGVGLASPVGAVNIPGSYPQIFVIGTDGNMWVAQWNGSSYPWTKLPPPSYPIDGLGAWAATQTNLPYGIALAPASWEYLQVYQESSGGPWAWITGPLGSPSQPPLAFTVGTDIVTGLTCFVTNGGSVLVEAASGGVGLTYINLGLTYPAKASAGVTYAQYGLNVFLVNTNGDLEVIYGTSGNLGNAEAIDLGTPP